MLQYFSPYGRKTKNLSLENYFILFLLLLELFIQDLYKIKTPAYSQIINLDIIYKTGIKRKYFLFPISLSLFYLSKHNTLCSVLSFNVAAAPRAIQAEVTNSNSATESSIAAKLN